MAGVDVAPRIVEQFVVGLNMEALARSLRRGAAKIRRAGQCGEPIAPAARITSRPA
jgi:hypothetical protein